MVIRAAVLLILVGLVACQTSPQVEELTSRNQELRQQLTQARDRIDTLAADKQNMQEDIDELSRVNSILDTEKNSRVKESTELRSRVRGFVQRQIDDLRQFLVAGELLDYIGDELVDRRWVENEDQALLLVDLDNRVPRNGTLTGVGAHLGEASPFVVKVLRPIEEELVVIWESPLIKAKNTGLLREQFSVSVGIEKGDYLAYYFPEKAGASFDEGTGNTRYIKRDLKLGDSIRRADLQGEDKKRSYSLGVYGLLNLEQ